MKKTVLLIGHDALAAYRFRSLLIKDLLSNGVKVFVALPGLSENTRKSFLHLGAVPIDYSLQRTGQNPFSDLLTVWRLWRLCRSIAPDVVFSFSAKPVVWGMIASFMAKVPHRVALVEGLGYVFVDPNGVKRRLLRVVLTCLYWAAFRAANVVVVLNKDDKEYLRQHCGLQMGKAVQIDGIGLSLTEWPPCPPYSEPITFTLVARMLKEKGVVEFVKAAALVSRKEQNIRFLLLGGLDTNPGGISEENLLALIANGNVEWLGQVDVKEYLERTSVFVLPSYREGLPRSTQEAMAMSRPVITTDVPGCRETVTDGVNGFIVPARDVEALEEAMLKFVHRPALLKTMGYESRKIAESRFDVKIINSKFIEILQCCG